MVGTDGCDIWEVDQDPQLLIEGNVGNIYNVAVHPCDPRIFATAAESDEVSKPIPSRPFQETLRVTHGGE